jgi:alanyl-tRNA synthetase
MTQEIVHEYGFKVDENAFKAEMQTQRLRSQKAHKTVDLTSDKIL